VYKARHVKVGRLFAVKVLHPRTLVDPKVAQRFAREAELAGRLRHPNVVGVVDVGEIDGTRYMVMDFAEGPDLAKLLDEAPMPSERIVRLVRQMLEGLYHAHEQGLIHRDFKPENVIVERDAHGGEMPRIVDFGIALLREGSGSVDGKGRLTTNGLVLGTPHYMAPEQAVADPIDHRIDLFALGIVIYEMLSGRLPFDGGGAEVARANLLLDPPLIKQRVPHLEVDPLLEAFARRLMAKRREARPATARAARELLDLIEHDRQRAAGLLGVPIARSGRAPAVTEPVDAEAAGSMENAGDATVPMKPTPRPAPPVALSNPSAPPGQAATPADGSAPMPWLAGSPVGPLDPPPSEIAPPYGAAASGHPGPVVYPPHPLARPADGAHGPPRGYPNPHRDTALRTPLGWQTALLPGRRRPWLIGGAAVGTACVIAAAVLSFTGMTRDEPVTGDRLVGPGSAPAAPTAPASPASPRSGDAKPTIDPAGARAAQVVASAPAASNDPVAAAVSPEAARGAAMPDDAAPTGAKPAAATRSSTDDGRRSNPPKSSRAPGRAGGGAPGRAGGGAPGGSTAGGSPAGGSMVRGAATRGAPAGGSVANGGHEPELSTHEPPGRASPAREPAAREPSTATREPSTATREPSTATREPSTATRDAKPSRSETPRASKGPAGVSPAALRALYDTVWREVGQLPSDKRADLTSQMLMFKINDEMQAEEPQRDKTAAQLLQILDEARRRKAQ
jgi:serine/threonine-protein kinase